MNFQDMNNMTVPLTFDISNEDSPIAFGMDVKIFSITDKILTPLEL